MDLSLADQVRAVALRKYVGPAKKRGAAEFSIAVKDLLKDLESVNFPLNYTPLVCNSIKTKRFQEENQLEITAIDGPGSKLSTTVVVHYKVRREENIATSKGSPTPQAPLRVETPKEKADRLVEEISGILREEIASYGGAEGFIRWVRSEDEEAR